MLPGTTDGTMMTTTAGQAAMRASTTTFATAAFSPSSARLPSRAPSCEGLVRLPLPLLALLLERRERLLLVNRTTSYDASGAYGLSEAEHQSQGKGNCEVTPWGS